MLLLLLFRAASVLVPQPTQRTLNEGSGMPGQAEQGGSSGHPLHAVVILVDDLGYSDTEHMGAEYSTPHISKLAKAGVQLNQSYASTVCSPSRASLLSSRYDYHVGMDGEVLKRGDARCLNVTTVGQQMKRNGVHTAFIGKQDVGYSSWACTPNCNGFDYFLGFYGPAQYYYLHGVSPQSLDFHENFAQAPQYVGEYSTNLFTRKAIEWIRNTTNANPNPSTFLYFSTQAVHTPLDAPPGNWPGCSHIGDTNRRTYCAIAQSLDEGIGNLTQAYKNLGIFDDTVFLFLSDNGGDTTEGGFNMPLRGGKGSLWEGGVRTQTFLHWSGFSTRVSGSTWGGMAHVADWGVTLTAALGHVASKPAGEPDFDGVNLWPALQSGDASPRTEILLSMRAAGECVGKDPLCRHPGYLAYRKGRWKLIYGKPGLSGSDECGWQNGGVSCPNGWAVPHDSGPSRRPPFIAGRNSDTSIFEWGGAMLFDIESDPLEEHEVSERYPDIVRDLAKKLALLNVSHIDQSTFPPVEDVGVPDFEKCGDGKKLRCAMPWLGPRGASCPA